MKDQRIHERDDFCDRIKRFLQISFARHPSNVYPKDVGQNGNEEFRDDQSKNKRQDVAYDSGYEP